MALEAAPSSFYSPWPDRLRHSAIILLAAGMALAVLVALGELSLLRAGAVFVCIGAAALVPWRLNNAVASREDVRGVNPVEAAAVSAVVAVIFVSATLLGFASHSPGGLGVFDAAMLVGLWQMDREDLLAGMLLFRVLYYIAPFVISVILLTFREVILGARLKRLRQLTPGPDAEPRREAVYVRERGDSGA